MARYRSKSRSDAEVAGSIGSGRSLCLPLRRCAIYTRKSTEEGLDQGFNSLDAQREACEAYVASQRHEGWQVLRQGYDDGGYSGGSMARPGLQALLSAVDAGAIDVVVVYKVDRLTRSLADFARIVDRFDRAGVSFVSVTQAFNTTSSMGRLTLNVLLSFAQFEREVGAERVRDKVAVSRKKGLWMGGTVPLGYRAVERRLVIDEDEARTVRSIFSLYLELGSTGRLLAELRQRGIVTAVRASRSGRKAGGIPFGPGAIDYLLHNRIYVGEVEHKGEVYPGAHEAILDRATFEAVQQRLAANANTKRLKAQSQAILTGRIFDSRANRMAPTHSNKGGVRYHYYVTRAIAEGRPKEAGAVKRVPAREIERVVLDTIAKRCGPSRDGEAELHQAAHDPGTDVSLIQRHLKRIEVHADHLRLLVVGMRLAGDVSHTSEPPIGFAIPAGVPSASDSGLDAMITIRIAWTPPAGRPRRKVQLAAEPKPDPLRGQIIDHIVVGRRWLQELIDGQMPGIEAIAKREGKHPRSIRAALSFALIAPEIVERIVDGGPLPDHLTLTAIGRGLPMLWSEQRRMFAVEAASAG